MVSGLAIYDKMQVELLYPHLLRKALAEVLVAKFFLPLTQLKSSFVTPEITLSKI